MAKVLAALFAILYSGSLIAATEIAQNISTGVGSSEGVAGTVNAGGLSAVTAAEGSMMLTEITGLAVVVGAVAAASNAKSTTGTTSTTGTH